MLRELFGFCLPVLLSTPLFDHRAVEPKPEVCVDWLVWSLKWREETSTRFWGMYAGKVLEITPDTMTVHQSGTLWPRTFTLAPALLSDRIPLNGNPGMGYRLRDIRLGDVVDLDVVCVRDGLVCTGIGIGRRPGGKIPPGEDPPGMPEFARRHHFYNRLQFMEERIFPRLPTLVSPIPARLMR